MSEPVWAKEVVLAQRGDDDATSELVRRFMPLARSTARRLVGDAGAVDDVVQEAFIEAFATIRQLRAPLAFPAWLRLIVRKHADRARRTTRATESLDDHEDLAAPDPGPELVAEQLDVVRAVRIGMAALAEPDRRLLELRHLAGWTVPELADLLAISPGATRKRLHDARQRLRPILDHLQETTMTGFETFLGRIHAADIDVPDAPAPSRPSPLAAEPTGLMVLDLIAPVVRGGTIEMVGATGTGHLVVILELLYRLGRTEQETACVAVGSSTSDIGSFPNFGGLITDIDEHDRNAVILTTTGDEAPKALQAGARLAAGLAASGVDVIFAVDVATVTGSGLDAASIAAVAGLAASGGSVTAVLVNALPRTAPLPAPFGLDTRLVFSVEQLALGIFPALDPVRSRATFVEPDLAPDVRRLLDGAAQVRAYFHQPMYVAAPHTGETGAWVDPVEAEGALSDLLATSSGRGRGPGAG